MVVAKIGVVYEDEDYKSGSNEITFSNFYGRQSDSDETIERMRISSTGKVGIGTNNPETELQVVGSIQGSSFNVGSNVLSSFQVSARQPRLNGGTSYKGGWSSYSGAFDENQNNVINRYAMPYRTRISAVSVMMDATSWFVGPINLTRG